MSRTLTIRLTPDQATWLKSTSQKTGVAQGRIVRDQIECARQSKAPRFMRLAGAISAPRDLSTRKGFSR